MEEAATQAVEEATATEAATQAVEAATATEAATQAVEEAATEAATVSCLLFTSHPVTSLFPLPSALQTIGKYICRYS